MSPYLTHLLSDIEAAIVACWRINPPHFWVMGMLDPYLVEPKELVCEMIQPYKLQKPS
ncbi:MAG: hypothetical protein IPM98_07255 [Lewinellaceae bacterium]|nr:hypothetical protein [Lewinellaceae bacterium]